jgi:phosphatidylinositol-3,4,5-trisphosphate 3-phosphatase/dual-specificity protein phosphatase PTEN
MLFEVCNHMLEFLNMNDSNVAVVHCNAGKGRTGTAISSFLIYSGIADNFLEAIIFYGWKRFSNGRGVTQPA